MGGKVTRKCGKCRKTNTITKKVVEENKNGNMREIEKCIFCQVEDGEIKDENGDEFEWNKTAEKGLLPNPLHPDVNQQILER